MAKAEPLFPPFALRRGEAARHVGVSPPYFDRLVDLGVMPSPRFLGENVKVWIRQEIEQAAAEAPSCAGELPGSTWDDVA